MSASDSRSEVDSYLENLRKLAAGKAQESRYFQNQVRAQASLRALEVAEEEWRRGNTKYALEAYEAVGVPVDHPDRNRHRTWLTGRLYAMTVKLFEAEAIVREWHEELGKTAPLSSQGHISNAPCRQCIRCKAKCTIHEQYRLRVLQLLGWNEDALGDPKKISGHYMPREAKEFRAAAVACLKLIKRT